MNINQAATRKDFIKLVARQLVVTRAARDNHGFNIQIIERVCHAMKKHAVVCDDLFRFVKITRAALWIAAT